jgi:hypothetical protein
VADLQKALARATMVTFAPEPPSTSAVPSSWILTFYGIYIGLLLLISGVSQYRVRMCKSGRQFGSPARRWDVCKASGST